MGADCGLERILDKSDVEGPPKGPADGLRALEAQAPVRAVRGAAPAIRLSVCAETAFLEMCSMSAAFVCAVWFVLNLFPSFCGVYKSTWLIGLFTCRSVHNY